MSVTASSGRADGSRCFLKGKCRWHVLVGHNGLGPPMHDLLVGDIAEVVLDRTQMPVATTSTATYTLPGEGELSLVRRATRTL